MADKASILLIDDEAALLRLMQIWLTRVGYEVQVCGDSASAHALLASRDNSIDLAVVDLSLIDGRKGLMELAALRPDMRILICSGSLFEVRSLPPEMQPRFDFLQKPFVPAMLAEAIEALLRRRTAGRH